MTFVVTLIALLLERFFDWGHLRQWGWFTAYRRALEKMVAGKSAHVVLAVVIVPMLLLVGIIQYALSGVLFNFINLIFQLLVVLYCLGPQNLWADTFACINALGQGDSAQAADKLKKMFGVTDISNSQTLHQQFLKNIFVEANHRVFAVVFWYALLGPIGAVLYRLMVLSAPGLTTSDANASVSQDAYKVESVMDWLPVRVFTFIFALGGNFVKALTCWRKDVMYGMGANENMLAECGMAALGVDDLSKVPEDGSIERQAISLLDRVFVILLVIVAVLVIIF